MEPEIQTSTFVFLVILSCVVGGGLFYLWGVRRYKNPDIEEYHHTLEKYVKELKKCTEDSTSTKAPADAESAGNQTSLLQSFGKSLKQKYNLNFSKIQNGSIIKGLIES